MARTKIGTFTLTEPTVYRKSYETASWYTDVEVQPGEYEVTTDGYWALIEMPGTVVGSYFVSRLLHCSSAHIDEDVGNDATYTIQDNLYQVDKWTNYTPTTESSSKGTTR
jgi:hypothetical protein